LSVGDTSLNLDLHNITSLSCRHTARLNLVLADAAGTTNERDDKVTNKINMKELWNGIHCLPKLIAQVQEIYHTSRPLAVPEV